MSINCVDWHSGEILLEHWWKIRYQKNRCSLRNIQHIVKAGNIYLYTVNAFKNRALILVKWVKWYLLFYKCILLIIIITMLLLIFFSLYNWMGLFNLWWFYSSNTNTFDFEAATIMKTYNYILKLNAAPAGWIWVLYR